MANADGTKSGGRQRGSRNRVTESMRRDILGVYRSLGGRKFLLKWARENESEFVKQCLNRVMPPAPRPEPDDDQHLLPEMNTFEAARRLAFLLAKADQETQTQNEKLVATSHRVVEEPPSPDPNKLLEQAFPQAEEPAIEEPPPHPSQVEPTIESYRGCSTEQGEPRLRARRNKRDLI